jgi:hypothetical protein
MKTTLDIPDPIFRQAKARAALRGVSLRQFVTEALQEKVASATPPRKNPAQPPWMRSFGALADIREETRLIDATIAEAFETLDEDDRA